jgi:hypothetical protein
MAIKTSRTEPYPKGLDRIECWLPDYRTRGPWKPARHWVLFHVKIVSTFKNARRCVDKFLSDETVEALDSLYASFTHLRDFSLRVDSQKHCVILNQRNAQVNNLINLVLFNYIVMFLFILSSE